MRREIKQEYDSDDSLYDELNTSQVTQVTVQQESTMNIDANQLSAIIDGAVRSALAEQENRLKQEFRAEVDAIKQQVNSLQIDTPQVEVYSRISIDPAVRCEVKLDIVKSIPEFDGEQSDYVAWRQSAVDAYEIFRPYQNSEAHYQAVTILRNKIRGSARALLVSHSTVLNFDAVIARLDVTYADKTSLRVLRQKLEMVRQGELSLMQYYDEVQKSLTLVTNKIIMSHNANGAALLNAEVRNDALHAFISGLKRSLKAIVFPAQPKDLPAALALAAEAEASIERSMFANSYAKAMEERNNASEGNRQPNRPERNPHYTKKQGQNRPQQAENTQKNDDRPPQEPMEVDSSSKFRQQTNWNPQKGDPNSDNNRNQKRSNNSEQMTGQRRQRVNNISQQAQPEDSQKYQEAATAAVASIDDDSDSGNEAGSLNFLEDTPGCRLSKSNWLERPKTTLSP